MDGANLVDLADWLLLLAGSVGVLVVLLRWQRGRQASRAWQLRRMVGAGALIGAAALAVSD